MLFIEIETETNRLNPAHYGGMKILYPQGRIKALLCGSLLELSFVRDHIGRVVSASFET